MTQNQPANSADALILKRLNRRRLFRGVLLSGIIFVGGGVTGWGVAMHFRPPPHLGPGMQPDPPIADIVRHMQNELLLTDEQTLQITDIYTKRFTALKAIRQDMGPKLKTEYDGLHADVQKVLTDAQFKRWNDQFQAVRNRMLPPDQMPPRRPPPPDGGQPPPPFGGPGGPNGGGPDRFPPPPPFGGPPDQGGRPPMPPP